MLPFGFILTVIKTPFLKVGVEGRGNEDGVGEGHLPEKLSYNNRKSIHLP